MNFVVSIEFNIPFSVFDHDFLLCYKKAVSG